MKIQNYIAQSAFSFVGEIHSKGTQNKKIAILALAAITALGLLAACYFAYSHIFPRKIGSPTKPQDQKTPLEKDQSPASVKTEASDKSKLSPQLKNDPRTVDSHESPFKPISVQLSPKTPKANSGDQKEILGSPKTGKDPLSKSPSQRDFLPASPSQNIPALVSASLLKKVPTPKKIPVHSEQTPQNMTQKTPPSPHNATLEDPAPHRIPEVKERCQRLADIETPKPFPWAVDDPVGIHKAATPLQTQNVEKVGQQKEEKKEIVYLFSPYDFSSAEQLLRDTYPGISEIKTSLEKTYQQVVFTNDPQIVKGAPVLFFLGKNTRIDLHNCNVIQILERLGSNVLILLFDQTSKFSCYSREDFKDFLKPESVEEGPGKGTIAADVLEKYRNFDSFLIFEYFTTISNTGIDDTITRKFKGNVNPSQEILMKLKEMEQNAADGSHSGTRA